MAEETSGQEKTEEPTARRLQEARKKGDIAKSTEIPSAAVLLASLLTLYLLNEFLMTNMYTVLKHYLGNLHTIRLVPDQLGYLSRQGLTFLLVLCGPVMVVVFVVGIFANVMQFGFLFTGEKLIPKLSKISPIEGVKRMFSMQMLMNTLKSILKVILIAYVAYREVAKVLPDLNPLMEKDPFQIAAFVGTVSFWIFRLCLPALRLHQEDAHDQAGVEGGGEADGRRSACQRAHPCHPDGNGKKTHDGGGAEG